MALKAMKIKSILTRRLLRREEKSLEYNLMLYTTQEKKCNSWIFIKNLPGGFELFRWVRERLLNCLEQEWEFCPLWRQKFFIRKSTQNSYRSFKDCKVVQFYLIKIYLFGFVNNVDMWPRVFWHAQEFTPQLIVGERNWWLQFILSR